MSRLKAIAADRDRSIADERAAELEAATEAEGFAITGEDAEDATAEASE